MKNVISIEICDKEYAIETDESEDYTKSLATEINKMIEDITYRNLRTSKADAAVLTCIHLCDKNRRLMDDNDNMRKTIAQYVDEIQILHKKLASYERQKSPKGSKFSSALEMPDDDSAVLDEN
ncbi:MAG: cell division protein ZapA [Oscillospiraceae bacterium]|nr:cell division protein ZapA [Oscillospiraceae bacterium]